MKANKIILNRCVSFMLIMFMVLTTILSSTNVVFASTPQQLTSYFSEKGVSNYSIGSYSDSSSFYVDYKLVNNNTTYAGKARNYCSRAAIGVKNYTTSATVYAVGQGMIDMHNMDLDDNKGVGEDFWYNVDLTVKQNGSQIGYAENHNNRTTHWETTKCTSRHFSCSHDMCTSAPLSSDSLYNGISVSKGHSSSTVSASCKVYNRKQMRKFNNTGKKSSGYRSAGSVSATSTASTTIPAHDQYSITFNANGGDGAPDSQYYCADSSCSSSDDVIPYTTPYRNNYRFAGWNTSPSGSGTQVYVGRSIYDFVSSGNVTLYAQWTYEPPTYHIYYSEPGFSTQSKSEGESVYIYSTTPTKSSTSSTGYTVTLNPQGGNVSPTSLTSTKTTSYSFLYWYDEYNGSYYNPGEEYYNDADANMSARWSSNTKNGSITLPTPLRSGYIFNGWYTAATGGTKVNSTYTPTSNTTLYAQWTPEKYTVTYDGNGGTGAPASQTKTSGESLTLSSEKPVKDSVISTSHVVTLDPGEGTVSETSMTANNLTVYTFNNWLGSDGKTYAPGSSYTTNADIKMTAQWTSKEEAGVLELPTPTRTGYNFDGWYTAKTGGTRVNNQYSPTSNITLYAQYSEKNSQLKYDANGGTGAPANVTMTYTTSTSVSKVIPSRTGYLFKGWNTKANGNGINYKAGDIINAENEIPEGVTLYAQWVEISAPLSYDPNGGEGTPATETMYYTTETKASLIVPTRLGYIFNGWNTERDGSGTTYRGNEVVKAANVIPVSTRLYAQWEEITATLTYNANGGSGAPADTTMRYSKATDVSFDEPVQADKIFICWNTKADGSGKLYKLGDTIKEANIVPVDTTLYAQWLDGKYAITYDANGGKGAPLREVITAEKEITVSAEEPQRTGFTFEGWNTRSDGGGDQYAAGDVIKKANEEPSNITLYAQWEPIAKTITYVSDGEVLYQELSVYTTETYITDNKPTKEGSLFAGWKDSEGNRYLSGEKLKDANKMPVDMTLNAVWTDKIGVLTYYVDGEIHKTVNMTYEDTIQAIAGPAQDDRTFVCWKTSDDVAYEEGAIIKYANELPKDMELTAVYEKSTATLTYHANEGIGSVPDSATMRTETETRALPPSLTRDGYIFKCWSTTPTGEGIEYYPDDNDRNIVNRAGEIPKDTDLYACWKEQKWKVTYNLNGGSPEIKSQVTYYSDKYTITDIVPKQKGYEFIGWTLDKDGKTKAYKTGDILKYANSNTIDGEPINGEITLYAQWQKLKNAIPKLNVNYNFYESSTKDRVLDVEIEFNYKNFFSQDKTIKSRKTVIAGKKNVKSEDYLELKDKPVDKAGVVEDITKAPDEPVDLSDLIIECGSYEEILAAIKLANGWKTVNGQEVQEPSQRRNLNIIITDNINCPDSIVIPADYDKTLVIDADSYYFNSESDSVFSIYADTTINGGIFKSKDYVFYVKGSTLKANTVTTYDCTYTAKVDDGGLFRVNYESLLATDYIAKGSGAVNLSGSVVDSGFGTTVIDSLLSNIKYTVNTGYYKEDPTAHLSDSSLFIVRKTNDISEEMNPLYFFPDNTSKKLVTSTELYEVRNDVSETLEYISEGSVFKTEEVSYGDEYVITSEVPVKDGSTFVGWAKRENGPVAYYPGGRLKGSQELISDYLDDNALYAVWDLGVSYSIVYNDVEGATFTSPNPSSYKKNTSTIKLNNPKKEGYTFVGWTGSNGNTPELTVTIPKGSTGNRSYTAHWKEITATLSYDLNGGTGDISDVTMKYTTETKTSKTVPEKEGYDFKEWNTKSDGKGTAYQPEDVINAANKVPSDIVLYAQWTEKTAKLTYDANTGVNPPAEATMKYTTETKVTSEVPTKDSYIFLGWNTEADGSGIEYQADDVVNAENEIPTDITLYAQWEKDPNKRSTTLVTGSEFNAAIPETAESVVFTDEASPSNAALTDLSDEHDKGVMGWLDGTTFKVSTRRNGVKVKTNADASSMFDGQANTACKNLTSIDATNLDTSITTDMSYMFSGAGYSATDFNLDLSGLDTSAVTNMTAMFSYAGYKADTFSLKLTGFDTSSVENMGSMFNNAGNQATTWSVSGITGFDTASAANMSNMFRNTPVSSLNLSSFDTSSVTSMSNMFTGCAKLEKVTFGDKFAWVGTDGYLPVPDNANISGADGNWYNKSTGTSYAPEDIPNNTAATYVADPSEIQYPVTYKANGGTGTPSDQVKNHDANLVLSSTEPTKASTSADGYKVTLNVNGGSVSQTSLTAKNTTTYTFNNWLGSDGKIYAPGATYSDNAGLTLTAQWSSNTVKGKVDLPTPTREGYTFNGWYTAETGGTKVTSPYAPSSDTTLYAQWTEKTATLTYDANGGDGAPSNVTMKYSAVTTVSSTAPTKTGHTFSGWNTKADGTGTSYASGDTLKPANTVPENVTLYAQWSVIPYLLKYDANGGTNAPAETGLTYESEARVSDVIPVKTGYVFNGWNTEINGSGTAYAAGDVVKDANTDPFSIVLYAQWTEKTALLTYNANGGDGAPGIATMSYSKAATISDTIPTRPGYTFKEWNTEVDGSGTAYAAGAEIKAANKVPSATILHAQWEAINATLATGSNVNAAIPDNVVSVVFTDEVAPKNSDLVDLSAEQNNGIVAWVEGSVFKISTQKTGEKVKANPDSSNMFSGYENIVCEDLINIDVTNLDTSQVTNMSYMFHSTAANASSFNLDLSGWDTSQVTRMDGMFQDSGFSASTFVLDLSNWDTSNVTDMSQMFYWAGYSASTSWSIGDLSSWDTSKVTDMSGMFQESFVTNLNLSSFDTSKVTDMNNMFAGCEKLEKVTLGDKFAWVGTNGYLPAPSDLAINGADGKWYNEDTGTSYAPADIPSNTAATYVAVKPKPTMVTGKKFCDTIPSTATSIVFSDESAPAGASLTDVSEPQDGSIVAWLDGTTYKVSTQESGDKVYANPDSVNMFNGIFNSACENLTNIDVTNLDTSKVTNMLGMFLYAGYNSSTFNIEGLSGWNTSKVTNMSSMFYSAGYSANTFSIGDISSWDTSKVTDMSQMFCSAGYNSSTFSIEGLSSWNTSRVTDMSYMFNATGRNAGTWSIGDLNSWNTSQVTNMRYMFNYAGSNASTWNIGDLSNWNTSRVTDMGLMFRNTPVTSLNLLSFDTSKVTDMMNMFDDCTKLEKVTLGDKFAWVGTTGYLPAPSSTYIDRANGKWYNLETGTGYAPADIPSNTAATYMAAPIAQKRNITLQYGNGDPDETISASYSFQLPNPTKDGMVFEGWYYKGTKTVTENITQFYNPNSSYAWSVDSNGIWSSGNAGSSSTTSTMISKEFTLVSGGMLSFDWRSNGESGYDYLGYDIYNVTSGTYLSGNSSPSYSSCIANLKGKASSAYTTVTHNLPAGTYKLFFQYGKDGSVNSNEDKGFVKNVKYVSEKEGFLPAPITFTSDMTLIAKWAIADGTDK